MTPLGNTTDLPRRIGLIWLLMAILGACAVPGREAVPLNTYLFSLDETLEVVKATDTPGRDTLLVSVPRARPGFDTPRMAYMHRPHELRYYASSQWAETPARMFAPLLLQTLERTGGWAAVVPMPTVVRGRFRLDTDNLSLRQEFFDRPSQVRLQGRVQLVDLQQQCVIATRGFEVVEATPTDDAYGGVLATNQAVGKLLELVARWALTSMSAYPEDGCRP